MANDELGRIGCECGAVASVYQAKRKGAHLYSRCPACGLDQRTGARVQARLYWLTDWNGGNRPARPENVPEARPDWLDRVEPIAEPKKATDKPAAAVDFDPTATEPGNGGATEKPTESEPESGLKALAGLALIVAAVGGLLWKF